MVVNADSMQVFREWRILTARPDEAHLRATPHRLFGHVGLWDDHSVGHWLDDLRALLEGRPADEPPPVIVGGSGAYFAALTRGLAPVPRIRSSVRAEVQSDLERLGLESMARELREIDPETASGLALDNPRRVTRALEVLRQTGEGLASWHRRTATPLIPSAEAELLHLAPSTEVLDGRIAERLRAMMRAGALEEVASVLELGRVPEGRWPLGGRELLACLKGEIGEEQAVQLATTATRRYAKRQRTWFRNQMRSWRASADESAVSLLERVAGRTAPQQIRKPEQLA